MLCIVFTIALINLYTGSVSDPFGAVARNVFTAFSTGTVVGILGALLWSWVLKNSGDLRFDYILTLGVIFIFYYVSESLGGNGAITSLMFGLIMGNSAYLSKYLRTDMFTIRSTPIKQFHEEISFFISTFFFVYLGSIVVLSNPFQLVVGIGLSAVLLLMRYATVPLATAGAQITDLERSLVSVVSARGLAAAVLATLPSLYGVKGSEAFSDIVFVVIIVSVVMTSIGYALLMGKENDKAKVKKK